MGGDIALALEHAHARARMTQRELARYRQPEDAASDDREIAALGRRAARGRELVAGLGHREGYPATVAGPPGAVAAAASSSPAPYRRSSPPPPSFLAVARRRAVICAGVGCLPSTPLAIISAAVAATCGVAIEVPSYPEGMPKRLGELPANVTW